MRMRTATYPFGLALALLASGCSCGSDTSQADGDADTDSDTDTDTGSDTDTDTDTDTGSDSDTGSDTGTGSDTDTGTDCSTQGWTADIYATRLAAAPNQIAIGVSNGDGTFDAAAAIGADLGEPMGDLAIGDFDDDGSIEIVARGADTGGLYLAEYDACEDAWSADTSSDFPYERVEGVADLDGDGLLDLYGFAEDGSTGYVSIGLGDGTFDHRADAFDTAAIWQGYQMQGARHAADVDGDDELDLVLTTYPLPGDGTSTFYLYPGVGDGTFGDPIQVGTLSPPANAIDLGDVTDDGLADIVTGLDDDLDPGQAYLFAGNGVDFDGVVELFDIEPARQSGFDVPGSGDLALFDWDGDGDDDVLVATPPDSADWSFSKLDLWINDPTGTFAAPTELIAHPNALDERVTTP